MLKAAIGVTCFASAALAQMAVRYPHSIIPGGIQSAEQYAERQDAPDIGFLRPAVIDHDLIGYVNYRDGSETRWTGIVTIRKGETVWADKYGHMIRGRCGNRIVKTQPKTSRTFIAPKQPDLDTPQVSFVVPPEISTPMADALPFEFPERWPDEPATIDDLPLIPGTYTPLVSIRPGERPWWEQRFVGVVIPFGGQVSSASSGVPEPRYTWPIGSVLVLFGLFTSRVRQLALDRLIGMIKGGSNG